jgi:polyisoprenoid-binding protein YceI
MLRWFRLLISQSTAAPCRRKGSLVKRPFFWSLFLAAAALGISSLAVAEPKTFQIDVSHSEMGFNIRHFFSKVHGRFDDFSGTIVHDPKNLAASSVTVVIQDSSISTGNARRDTHLRSQDFFWVEKHPTITFKSTKVTPGKDSLHYKVAGDLTIRGITKPVVLDVEHLGTASMTIEGRDMGMRSGFTATTTINRKDYEIVWNRTVDQGGVMLGDDVEIVLNVEAVSRENKETSAAKPAAGGSK